MVNEVVSAMVPIVAVKELQLHILVFREGGAKKF